MVTAIIAAACAIFGTTIATKIVEDIYNWLKPLVVAKFKRPKRYRILFV
ncbi:hypothetical protein [Ensifer sp. SL37]|nr:hypothetical protein [Ensifer sp. SL37]MCY1741455.1 hypothetical protein [Ensifer sp. SL37]